MDIFFPKALESHTEYGALNCVPTQNEYKGMRQLKFTCGCCGFVGVPSKGTPSAGLEFVDVCGKLYLLCMMCSQSQMLTRPLISKQGVKELNHGRLVYCPEVSQGKIISVVRDIYVLSMHQKDNQNRKLRMHIEELRQGYIGSLIERCTNIPALKITNNDLGGYAQIYKYASPELLKKQVDVFQGVRYIPDDVIFSHVIRYWLDTTYNKLIQGL